MFIDRDDFQYELNEQGEAKEAGADKVTIWGTGTPRREFLGY